MRPRNTQLGRTAAPLEDATCPLRASGCCCAGRRSRGNGTKPSSAAKPQPRHARGASRRLLPLQALQRQRYWSGLQGSQTAASQRSQTRSLALTWHQWQQRQRTAQLGVLLLSALQAAVAMAALLMSRLIHQACSGCRPGLRAPCPKVRIAPACRHCREGVTPAVHMGCRCTVSTTDASNDKSVSTEVMPLRWSALVRTNAPGSGVPWRRLNVPDNCHPGLAGCWKRHIASHRPAAQQREAAAESGHCAAWCIRTVPIGLTKLKP